MISSALPQREDPTIELTSQRNGEDTVLRRLLTYSRSTKSITASHKRRDLFTDLQRILGSDHIAWGLVEESHLHYCPRNDKVEDDITRLRNIMNSSQRPIIERKSTSLITRDQGAHNQLLRLPNYSYGVAVKRRISRHSSWNTPYGRIHATVYVYMVDSDEQATDADLANMIEQTSSTRVAVVPTITGVPSSYMVFEFISTGASIDLPVNLTYSPMIPNDSDIFTIIRDGEVHQLIKAFEEGHASLNDRDEQGRSLLNVSYDDHFQ